MGVLSYYFRISLEDLDKQHRLVDESQSISNQRKLVQSYVAQHPDLAGMAAVEYLDDGYTGTNFDRPQFAAMMEAAKRGEIACIVVKDLSRFGRNYLEVGDYLEHIFPFLGIRFIAVNDNYDSNDYVGKTGGMDLAFRNFIYESYSKDLSVKVRSAMRSRMEKGKFVNHVPFGYKKASEDKHRMIPDPVTAPVVRRIFLMVIGGKSPTQVAKTLNAEGVPIPLIYKEHKLKAACENRELMWTRAKILNILHNYKYTGAMTNHIRESRHLRDKNQRRVPKEDWIITENAHESIVSREEFEAAAQAIRKVRYTPHDVGDVSDRVFYCAHCGCKLKKYFGSDAYFSCDTPMYQDDAPCKSIRWSKTALEEVLLPIYRLQLTLLGEKAKAVELGGPAVSAEEFTRRMAQLEKSAAACDAEKIRLYEQYRESQITRDDFIRLKTELDDKKARLQAEHDQGEAEYEQREKERAQAKAKQQVVDRYLDGLDAEPEDIRSEMYAAIERVEVFDNEHIAVRWSFENLFEDTGDSDRQAG